MVSGQQHAPAALYLREKDPVPILQQAGWATGPVWTRRKNLVPTGIRFRNLQPSSSVAIPTELPGPSKEYNTSHKFASTQQDGIC